MSNAPKTPHSATPQIELTKTVHGLLNAENALPSPKPPGKQGLIGWMVEKAVDITILVLAILNLSAVFFDYSYVMLRPEYQRYLPIVVENYDRLKGIDPHRQTQDYLAHGRDALDLAANHPDDVQTLKAFKVVQQDGSDIIHDDPFSISNQRGVLERLKHQASLHMGLRALQNSALVTLSGAPDAKKAKLEFENHSTKALATFWTPENLIKSDYASERAWYEAKIAPLMNRAYYRHYGENGKPVEEFWRIDLAFSSVFVLELLLRAIWMLGFQRDRKKPFKQSVQEFKIARWMDFAYFLPLLLYAPIISDLLPTFIRESLQLVRMFSIGFRMQHLGMINPVEVVEAKIAATLDLITDMVNVKLLTNYQQSVQQMDIAQAMKALTPQQREQLTVLIQRNLTMVLRDVLPDITPQLEKLIMHGAQGALSQAPAYQQLKRLPLFGALPERLLPNLVAEVLAGTQVTMLKAINDEGNVKLTNEIIDAATDSLLKHMGEVGTEAEVKKLLFDMLEEQKRKVMAK